MEPIIFSRLNELVTNPELLCEQTTKTFWQIMPYATGEVEG